MNASVAAIEEKQDSPRGHPATRLFEAKVDRDCDATHVPDLEIEHDQLGFELGERGSHVLAARDLHDLLAGSHERRTHLVANPLRFGRYENRRHRG